MRHHCTSAGLRLTSAAADLSDWPSASIAFVSASRDPVASSGRRRKAVWRSVFTRRFGNAQAPRRGLPAFRWRALDGGFAAGDALVGQDAEVDLLQERTRLQTLEVANNAEWLTTIAMGDAVGITALGTQQDSKSEGVSYVPIADAPPAEVSPAWTKVPSQPAVLRWRDHTVETLQPAGLPIMAHAD